jgi:hypothetical protein
VPSSDEQQRELEKLIHAMLDEGDTFEDIIDAVEDATDNYYERSN